MCMNNLCGRPSQCGWRLQVLAVIFDMMMSHHSMACWHNAALDRHAQDTVHLQVGAASRYKHPCDPFQMHRYCMSSMTVASGSQVECLQTASVLPQPVGLGYRLEVSKRRDDMRWPFRAGRAKFQDVSLKGTCSWGPPDASLQMQP